jgi:hypothetical protein
MSPYLIFGLAMLGIVIFSLVVTGNLAAAFNDRAKKDLSTALEPLASEIGGVVELESAKVTGRHHGQITTGQVIPGPGGMGRLFQTTFVEPAGGESWKAVVRRPKSGEHDWERSFDASDALASELREPTFELLDSLLSFPGWFELHYEPDAGTLKLTRAMQSRRDIPTLERFRLYLSTLEQAAAANRAAQADATAPDSA